MTRDEFNQWISDLRKRMPDTYAWLREKKSTAELWFDDVFVNLEYDVCLSALSQIWQEGLAPYDRERLPAIVTKKHGEILWRRGESARKAEERRKHIGDGFYSSNRPHIRSMRRCYELVREIRDDDPIQQKAKRTAFIDQWFDDDSKGFDDGTISVSAEAGRVDRSQVGQANGADNRS